MDAAQQPRPYLKTSLYVRAAPSLKLRDRKVSRLVRRMFSLMPWLEPQDTPLCRSWAELQVVGDQVYAGLRSQGVLTGQGEMRRLADDFRKLRLAQATLAAALGMSPASRMAIKADSTRGALDIAAEMAVPEVADEPEDGDGVDAGNAAPSNGNRPPRADQVESLATHRQSPPPSPHSGAYSRTGNTEDRNGWKQKQRKRGRGLSEVT